MSKSSQEWANEFIEKYSFKQRIDEVVSKRDESLLPILSLNIAVFATTATVIFSSKDNTLTTPILLILVSALTSLICSLLNIWYLSRSRKRADYFKGEQEIVYKKVEKNIVKTFELLRKIFKTDIASRLKNLQERRVAREDVIAELNDDQHVDILVEDCLFIPYTMMDLALVETKLNAQKSFNEPLEESYPELKLFIDKLSEKTKFFGFILSASFVLVALLAKFIVG